MNCVRTSSYLSYDKKYISLAVRDLLTPRDGIHKPLKPSDRLFRRWLRFSLNAIERGRQMVETLAPFVNLQGKSVLDVGCGDGGLSIAFAEMGADVTGIDILPDRIERARIWASCRKEKIKFVHSDFLSNSWDDETFDVVVMNDVLEHVDEPMRVLQKMHQLLKPGGLTYIQAPNLHSPFNLLSDPHYGLFGVSVLPRAWAEWYVVKVRKIINSYDVGRFQVYTRLIRILQDEMAYTVMLTGYQRYLDRVNNRTIKKILSSIHSKELGRVFLNCMTNLIPVFSVVAKKGKV